MDAPLSPKREFPKPIDDDIGEYEKQVDQRACSGSGSRRTLSGNIFSRFPLFRASSDDKVPAGEGEAQDGAAFGGATAGSGQKKTRKRKGSLRKVALLGGRDRKSSDAKKSPLSSPNLDNEDAMATFDGAKEDATPRQSYEEARLEMPLPRWPGPRTSVASIGSSGTSIEPASSLTSATSPTAPTEASLTDDDESLSFPRLQINNRPKVPSSSGDSYFPPTDQPQRRPSSRKTSPLAQPQALPVSPVADEEWDYSETAYWGYVILIVTWLVFVIGMGSCFGIWSWA